MYYSENHPEHDPSAEPLLEYNAGRDGIRGNRQPCLNNAATCTEGGRGYFELTNNKVSYSLFTLYLNSFFSLRLTFIPSTMYNIQVFLTTSSGLNSVSVADIYFYMATTVDLIQSMLHFSRI